jgi:hypothetical protein
VLCHSFQRRELRLDALVASREHLERLVESRRARRDRPEGGMSHHGM